MNLAELLHKRALQEGKRTAFVYLLNGETQTCEHSYGQLDQRARSVAAFLQSQIPPQSRVVLAFPFGPAFIEALFGCMYAGMIAVPTPSSHIASDGPRIRAAARDCDAGMVLTIEDNLAALHDLDLDDPISALWVGFETIRTSADDWRAVSLSDTDIAFLQYTSGSASEPKGVAVSHGSLIDNLAFCREVSELGPDTVIVSWLPHFFDLALVAAICLGPYCGGAVVQMAPEHFVQKPLRWLKALQRYRGTMALAPNFAFDLCVDAITPQERDQLDLHCWTSVICGGERVNPATMARFAAYFESTGFRAESLSPSYGLAEATLAVTVSPFGRRPTVFTVDAEAFSQDRLVRAPEDAPNTRPLAGLGYIPKTWEVVIVDPKTCRPCLPDTLGEIWIRGKGLSSGYWNRPEKTAEVFGGVLSDTGEGPYLRTGDWGAVMEGQLVVVGRQKDVIVIRGFNHYAQDIEQSVGAAWPHSKAVFCAAFAVQEIARDILVVAVEIGPEQDVEPLARAIREAVARDHGVTPDVVVFVAENGIPRTSTGKVQREVCRRHFEAHRLPELGRSVWRKTEADGGPSRENSVTARPITEIRLFLRQTVARYLCVTEDAIDPEASFQSLGLDSTAAVRLTGEVAAFIGQTLLPSVAFDYPTIEALSRYLSSKTASDDASPETTPQDDDPHAPVAIVGMACRFPGGPDLDAFWELLRTGGDAVKEVPPDRWDIDTVYDPTPATPGKMHTRWGGFIDQVDQFDAPLFRMSPPEAAYADPQHRLVLEVAWEALEHAGIAAEGLMGSPTGVFVGIGTVDYIGLQIAAGSANDAHSAVGVSPAIAANRLSYLLGLRGPSISMDTACSSALTAVHYAIQSLRRGECSLAMAAAVNLMLAPVVSVRLSQARMLSPTGRCRTFDKDADGYTRGEGCGVVVLKRLRDALADGDHIYAVVRGSAVNHSGHTNGITAPSAGAQVSVIRAALADADVQPEQVDYIEAHGTGTPLGDPIEFNSLTEAVLRQSRAEDPCRIASVKTNIGHLEIAAGMAGLIKTVLSLEHEAIPPHLHLHTLNPMIQLDGLAVRIPSAMEAWPRRERPRIACVNAFGFGGTNACLVLQEGPAQAAAPTQPGAQALLTLSAHNPDALRALAKRYAEWIPAHAALSLRDICATSNTGRSHFPYRLAVAVEETTRDAGHESLCKTLSAFAAGEEPAEVITGRTPSDPPDAPAFLFSGQGAQYPGMAHGLFESNPLFRAVLLRCEEILQPILGTSFLNVMFAEAGSDLIHQARFAQPALFAMEYALAECWAAWGIRPSCILGHSIGEIAAACRAGAFSLEDGLRIAAERGRLMQSLPPEGGMATVFAEKAVVEEVIAPYPNLVIAAYNGPALQVISGPQTGLTSAMAVFEQKGIRAKRMTVSHAFHSPLMEPILDAFTSFSKDISFAPLTLPLYSTVRGTLIPAGTILDAEYWRENIRLPVRFSEAIIALSATSVRQGVEVGPDSVLTGMARRAVAKEGMEWISSLRRNQNDPHSLLNALARLHVCGHRPDWTAVTGPAKRVALPAYPFQRKRCWIEYGQEDVRSFGVPGIRPIGEGASLALTPKQQQALARGFVQLDWTPIEALSAGSHAAAGAWLIAGPDPRRGEALAKALSAVGHAVRFVLMTPGMQPAADEIADFWKPLSVSAPEDARRCLVYLGDGNGFSTDFGPCLTFLSFLKHAMAQPADAPIRVVLATFGAHPVLPGDCPNPGEMALWGLGRTAVLENPGLMWRMVDLPYADSSIDPLCAALLAESAEPLLAWREKGWFGVRLDRFTPGQNIGEFRPRKDAAYLITGGLGALGIAVARWLAQQGARRLVLTGRSALPPRSEWKDEPETTPAYGRIQAILELERLGAVVHPACFDIADAAALAAWVSQYEQDQYPPIRGIFHLAGDLSDASLGRLTSEDFKQVFRPKVEGAWNLHAQFLNRELDCFVLFSSVSGLLGSPGQGNYAAANAWLDGLALRRRAEGLPALSIDWGPWRAAGMAARPDRIGRMERMGILGIDPEQGTASLGILAGQREASHVGVMEADWRRLGEGFEGAATFLARLSGEATDTPKDTLAVAIRQARGAERQALLGELLRERVAHMFGVAVEEIVLEKSPEALGIDSLAAMDMVRELSKLLDFAIVAREFFRHPTLSSFIQYVGREMDRSTITMADGNVIERIYAERSAELSFQFEQKARNPKIAFILSSPRSGSTLLRAMLSANSSLFAPPELHLLWFKDMKERQEAFQGVLGDAHMGKGLARAVMELRGLSGPEAEAVVQEWIDQQVPVSEVFRILQAEAAPRLLVDKSPSYALSSDVLRRAENMFESALFIHLYRHPYAVMESLRRQRLWNWFEVEGVSLQVLAEDTWALHNRHTLELLETIPKDRQFQVAFEDLVTRPEPMMKALCGFLNVPFERGMLFPHEKGAMLNDTKLGHGMAGDPNFLKRSSIDPALAEKWREVIPDRPVGLNVRAVAERLNYVIPSHAMDLETELSANGLDVLAMDEETL